MQTLAAKIAAFAGHSKSISLDVGNISSLTPADTAAIRQSLESELARHFHVVLQADSEAQVVVTLSEDTQGYIWVTQLRTESADHIEIIPVPKISANLDTTTTTSLALDKRLIWRQASDFLDFEIRTGPLGLSSSMLILEPESLVYYTSVDTIAWQLSQSVPLPHSTPWPRDPRGVINREKGYVDIANTRCVGAFDPPDKAQCSPKNVLDQVRPRPRVPGHDESETALLLDRCGEQSIVLSTGNGDWTHPDSIQGYLLADLEQGARASGDPLSVEGPVMSLLPGPQPNAARAVVHNLKTGNYEAYVVTANCTH